MTPMKATTRTPPLRPAERDPIAALADLRILIVEDVGLIAFELQQTLDELGCRIVGVAPRLDRATALAGTEQIDGVLLDLKLAGQDSYPVADILDERGIPFIIMSGYDIDHLRAEYSTAAHLQKPFGRDALTAMMVKTFVQGMGDGGSQPSRQQA